MNCKAENYEFVTTKKIIFFPVLKFSCWTPIAPRSTWFYIQKTYVGKLVEPAEQLVEQPDQVLRRALRGEGREAHDVREENAKSKKKFGIRKSYNT